MDRTAQRVLGPLRIVDQEMGTRQARPDSFAGDAELDAAIDMAEGSVPALDSRRVRRIEDDLVETQDVEKDDVLHARTRLGRERVFGSVQPGVRFVPPPAPHEREREVEHSLDALRKELGGERVEPCGCARHIIVLAPFEPRIEDELERPVPVTVGDVVGDRAREVAAGNEGSRGAQVQVRGAAGIETVEFCAQQILEQGVVAIRAAGFDRHEKVRLAFERFEARPAVAAAREDVAQIGIEIIDDGRAQHEVADVVGLALDDLLRKEIGDHAVASGEAARHTGLVGVAPRAGHEDQRGYPSLGPRLKFDDLARCEHWCAEGGKKRPGFVFVECEVALADVSDPRSRAPPRSR